MTIKEIIKEIAARANAAYYGALFVKEFSECIVCSEDHCDSACAAKKGTAAEKSCIACESCKCNK